METLGLDDAILRAALENLTADQTLIVDVFRDETAAGAAVEEICDSENLEILLRLRRVAERPEFKPLEPEALPLFLAAWQGLTAPGEGVEALQRRLDQLFGYPARAHLWETDVLPARLKPYYPEWLDTTLHQSELIWFGCGKERITLCFESDHDLFAAASVDVERAENGDTRKAVAELEQIFSGAMGKIAFEDILTAKKGSSLTSESAAKALWELAWQGRLTNDGLEVVRRGIMNRFRPESVSEIPPGGRRSRFNRWKNTRPFSGNWHMLQPADSAASDAIDRAEQVKDRIRLLLARYGILFREILWNELPSLRWAAVIRTLRLMELSGEIFTGHFFEGIPGLQFCSHSAFRLLNRPLPDDAIYWLNAADPASLCGIDLEGVKEGLPARLPSTHLVYQGKSLVLASKKNGKEIDLRVPPDHPRLTEILEFFKVLVGREFEPLKSIKLELINGERAPESPYAAAFTKFGFLRDYRTLTLWKSF